MKTRTRVLAMASLFSLALASTTTGCELIADFDRSLIDAGPVPTSEGGAPNDATVNDVNAPDTSAADVAQDMNVPDSNEPDANVGDTNVPDSNIGDTNVGDTHVVDSNVPDTNAPDSNVPDAHDAGCSSANDCPANMACDTATGACTTACSTSQACHGGCCSADTNGTCQLGSGDTACGTSGTCKDCTSVSNCTSGAACACGSSDSCVQTSIDTLTASVTGGVTSTLSWTTTNAATCTLDDGSGPASVSCNPGSPQSVSPTKTTTYTLKATGTGGTATKTVTISCGATSNPAVGGCPTGATFFCESVPIDTTSSLHAQDACNACNGASACSQVAGDATLGGASAWEVSDDDAGVDDGGTATVGYVYAAGSSAASPCTNTYTPAAGDVITDGTCPESTWGN